MSALKNIKVLDLTRVLSGPFCTAMLADMGAEVIKVEHPLGGDGAREPSAAVNGESLYFMSLNRGKKGITLNLKEARGLEILKSLIKKSDVIVENFRPGVMAKLGLSYPEVKEINPGIIYASISGFGQDSPMKHLPAFDLVAQAMGGIMSVNGQKGAPPTRVGVSLGDTSTAMYTAFAIVTALLNREKTGQGQSIDVSMVDSIFSLLEMSLFSYLGDDKKVLDRMGSRHPTSYPYDVFEARDGYFTIATFDNTGFSRLCEAMGRSELMEDERFLTDTIRGKNDTALKEIIHTWSKKLTVDQVLEILEQARVPSSPIYNIQQIAESEHIKARQMLVDVEHPVAGPTRLPAMPVKFSQTKASIQGPSPLLGEHTKEVLKNELGFDDEFISTLAENKII
ncbi:Crotonobetainyl-CoA:carnitine CoA-transferase CaiB [Desulfocicer vacuolatum DSM 3385]|uniref:Crotonobetainyl-CoA:carnitine CoA-transferase CaiB n=1 Tax=Desulfocicer vacuolatum DSM 3385 TaxID=1121400 RepID=A0A1W2EKG4_9BACT|nr:CoA transferase [Desulfocicer vacuolatum]SMD10174.1 Crotonobetainyl-CoA:carnitine CoA-transferase CaiB [Desulfocicer vacuolatum DSM 3385]